jgi:hypothetical protein
MPLDQHCHVPVRSLLHDYLRTLKLRSRGSDVMSVLRRVSANFLYYLETKSVFPENDLLLSLPPCLRRPLILCLYHRHIPRMPLLCQVRSFWRHVATIVEGSTL